MPGIAGCAGEADHTFYLPKMKKGAINNDICVKLACVVSSWKRYYSFIFRVSY